MYERIVRDISLIFNEFRVFPFRDFCEIYTWILKTGLAKISTHSTSWQFKTVKLVQRPIKSVYLTPGSKLMVPRSIPTSPNLK